MTQQLSKSCLRRQERGRRAVNPHWSMEERKRWRVLKNRESAMRSLVKKAEYCAGLEKLEGEAQSEINYSAQKLKQLLKSASELLGVLESCVGQPSRLSTQVNDAMVKARSRLEKCPTENVLLRNWDGCPALTERKETIIVSKKSCPKDSSQFRSWLIRSLRITFVFHYCSAVGVTTKTVAKTFRQMPRLASSSSKKQDTRSLFELT